MPGHFSIWVALIPVSAYIYAEFDGMGAFSHLLYSMTQHVGSRLSNPSLVNARLFDPVPMHGWRTA